MKSSSLRLGWVAPLLVGASAAIAAEVAIGILLYAGPGFVRSLTTILAVESVALGLGLRSAPLPRPDLVDRLRRRWLFCLGTFMVAAAFGTAWSVAGGLAGGRLGQGLGLAVLAALPLYACGVVVGGMGSVAASDPSGRSRGPGAASMLGGALGFVATGVLLPRVPIPASLLVGCLVLLSAGGMVYGIYLGSRPDVRLRASRPSRGGDVRVEDRTLGKVDPVRYLLEGEHVRRRASLDGEGLVPWDVLVARALAPAEPDPWRVLVLGGGASALPRAILDDHPSAQIEVLERTGAVVELARDHFDTDLTGVPSARVSIRVGNLEDLLAEIKGRYGLVLVDTSALAPLGGVSGLSRAAWGAIVSAVDGHGVLAWGPGAREAGIPEAVAGWHQTVLGRTHGGQEEVLILARPAETGPFPELIEDFTPLAGGWPAQ